MRKLYLVLIFLLVLTEIGLGQIANGDFESWTSGAPDGWTTIDDSIVVTEENSIYHNGSASASIEVIAINQAYTDLRQSISVVNGNTYIFSAFVYHTEGNLEARFYIDGFHNYSDHSIIGSWQEIRYEYLATSTGTIEIGLRFYDQENFDGSEVVYVDDFAIIPPDQEPTNHSTNFISSAISSSQIDLIWTDAVGTQLPIGYLIKSSTISYSSISAPVDGIVELDDTDMSDNYGVINISYGSESYNWTGLTESTEYYYKIYPYTNSGANIDYKTDGTVPEAYAITTAFTSLLLEENFNFAGNLTDNEWTNHSGPNEPISTTTDLIYTDYANSNIGNAANIVGTSEDVNRGFAEQNTNGSLIYLSFLVNVTEATSSVSGGYFLNLGNRATPTTFLQFCARVFVKVDVSDNVIFGISNTDSASYGTTNFSKNTTYLAIVKYTINTTGDDNVKLWIKSAGVPADELTAGTPEVEVTNNGQDIIDAIALRQAANIPDVVVDGIRIATAWNNAPVPVELTSFTATALTKGVILNWSTATEVNNYGFEIEKQNSDLPVVEGVGSQKSEWKKIDFVEGHGNSNSPKHYSFVDDSQVFGEVGYRLKQIDIDGTFEYSDVVTITSNKLAKYELHQNHPNPFNPSTVVSFTLPKATPVKITVYNSIGQKVIELLNKEMESGYHNMIFNGSDLSTGLYIYRLETPNYSKMMKMLLLK
ncbi:MAG: T9SS type A sorting domain-containing protein [Bacteroidota bacterium]